MRSIIAGATIWLLLAGAAVAGMFSVLSGIGSGTSGDQPHALSPGEISSELASPTREPGTTRQSAPERSTGNSTAGPSARHSTAPRTKAPHSQAPHTSPHRTAKQTDGGTVVASCTNGTARLDSWSPAPGFETDDVHRGPATVVSIEFEGDDRPDYLVTARCRNGKPAITSVMVDD